MSELSLRAIEGANWRRMVLRTIQNGHITIHGRTYRPETRHMPYDGRLDGMRYAFGRYSTLPNTVTLWGTEEMYRMAETDPRFEELWANAPDVVNGGYPWMWWHA